MKLPCSWITIGFPECAVSPAAASAEVIATGATAEATSPTALDLRKSRREVPGEVLGEVPREVPRSTGGTDGSASCLDLSGFAPVGIRLRMIFLR